MAAVARFAVVALVACHPRPVLPSPVTVRMAEPNELPVPVEEPPAPGISFPTMTCKLAGAPAPELRAAVVAFARAHLVDEIDRFTGYATADIATVG